MTTESVLVRDYCAFNISPQSQTLSQPTDGKKLKSSFFQIRPSSSSNQAPTPKATELKRTTDINESMIGRKGF